jgi:hypothetical protein
MSAATTPAAEQRRGRVTLIGLAALFFVPLALSFWLYFSGGWRPAASTNHGELISPAVHLENAALAKPDGSSARSDLLTGKWNLVYLGNGACDPQCQHTLVVRRVFIATADCCNRTYFEREHQGLEVVSAADAGTRDFLAQFPPTDREHSIYIVDPLGNLMMRFDARQSYKGLQSDINKLLKLSHIG